ncbi:MAG: hypothetical protein Q4F03_03650 [Eubacteriales bacterium]|nr:hypothetical protein [Eubacteriales bacterium]
MSNAQNRWQETHKYDDIMNLPRHISKKHRQMSIHDRAAQFAPFSALTGLDEALRETKEEHMEREDKR